MLSFIPNSLVLHKRIGVASKQGTQGWPGPREYKCRSGEIPREERNLGRGRWAFAEAETQEAINTASSLWAKIRDEIKQLIRVKYSVPRSPGAGNRRMSPVYRIQDFTGDFERHWWSNNGLWNSNAKVTIKVSSWVSFILPVIQTTSADHLHSGGQALKNHGVLELKQPTRQTTSVLSLWNFILKTLVKVLSLRSRSTSSTESAAGS